MAKLNEVIDLPAIIERCIRAKGSQGLKLCVVGDLLVDRTFEVRRAGRPTSLASGEFFDKVGVTLGLGGAPTVAKVLSQFGRTTLVVPRAGRGELQGFVGEALGADGFSQVEVRSILCDTWHVAEVSRFIEKDFRGGVNQLYRIQQGSSQMLSPVMIEKVKDVLCLDEFDATVISDYGRGFIDSSVCEIIGPRGGSIILDPSDRWNEYSTLEALDSIVGRRDQVEILLQRINAPVRSAKSSVDERKAAAALLAWFGDRLKNLILKDYGDSDVALYAVEASRLAAHQHTFQNRSASPASRLGGGTAFTAYYTVGSVLGFSPLESTALGQSAAMCMMALGLDVGLPNIEDLRNYLPTLDVDLGYSAGEALPLARSSGRIEEERPF